MAARIFTSSIVKKLGMSVTGLIWYGFLVGHLLGNTLLLKDDGGMAFNAYAGFLTSHPLLVPAEIFLVVVLALHLYLAIRVTLDNRRARPVGYAKLATAGQRNWASYTMIYSGIAIAVFLVVHLTTFKYGDRAGGTLYDLVVQRFNQPLYAGFYVVVMIILGFHLWHAFQSAMQTLSLGGQRLRLIGIVFCVLLAGGFAFLPMYVGLIK